MIKMLSVFACPYLPLVKFNNKSLSFMCHQISKGYLTSKSLVRYWLTNEVEDDMTFYTNLSSNDSHVHISN